MFIEITKQLRGYTRRWALRYCHCSFAVHLFTLINDHISGEDYIIYRWWCCMPLSSRLLMKQPRSSLPIKPTCYAFKLETSSDIRSRFNHITAAPRKCLLRLQNLNVNATTYCSLYWYLDFVHNFLNFFIFILYCPPKSIIFVILFPFSAILLINIDQLWFLSSLSICFCFFWFFSTVFTKKLKLLYHLCNLFIV